MEELPLGVLQWKVQVVCLLEWNLPCSKSCLEVAFVYLGEWNLPEQVLGNSAAFAAAVAAGGERDGV